MEKIKSPKLTASDLYEEATRMEVTLSAILVDTLMKDRTPEELLGEIRYFADRSLQHWRKAKERYLEGLGIKS